MQELTAAGAWIRAQTEAATGLAAYEGEHPGFNTQKRKVIVYSLARDEPVKWSGGFIVMRIQSWQVTGIVSMNDPDLADEISEQIHQSLHKKLNQDPLEGGRVLQSIDIGPALKFSSRDTSGQMYRHSGSFYELRIQKTT